MKQAETRRQNFIHGAAILTVGVVIMKILGALYKVPLGNILGDYGYGIFLSTYNVYNIFFTLSTAGLPVALSRMIAEADAHGKTALKEKTFRTAVGTFAVIGILFSLIMFFGNHFADPEGKNNALSSLAAISAGIRRFCAFDNDDSFENKLSVYNGLYSNSFVDRVWLFPTGIENETVPARKMMVSAVLGYTSNNDHKTTIYKYSLAKNHSDRLSSHFLSIKE